MGWTISRVFWIELPAIGYIIGFSELIYSLWRALGLLEKLEKYTFSNEDGDVDYFHKYLYTEIDFIESLWNSCTCVFMIIGIKKKIHYALLPWLISKTFAVTVTIALTLKMLKNHLAQIDSENYSNFVLTCGSVILILGCVCYVWLGVLSLYIQIREERSKPDELDAERLYTPYSKNLLVEHVTLNSALEFPNVKLKG